ncbi:MAG: hypothetical protein HYX68_07475 [Planctomycetes bacterium]|jgi:hypothetical protein|nr:hypothetical protein [Planctomycetota bacterium]
MVRRLNDIPRAAEDDAAGKELLPRRDVLHIRRTLESLAEAHCPLCLAPLIARQGRTGPYFACRCPQRKVA